MNMKKQLINNLFFAITAMNVMNPILLGNGLYQDVNMLNCKTGLLGAANNLAIKTIDSLLFATAEAFTTEVPSGGNNYIANEVVQAGVQIVNNNGIAEYTTINSEGIQKIYAGGKAISTIINSNGLQDIYKDGIAVNTRVNYYGIQYVHAGGTAEETNIYHGEQIIDSGGIANSTKIYAAGVQNIYFGGVADSTHIYEGGTQRVRDAGKATNTIIYSGGVQIVGSGGSASNTIINNGGVQYVNRSGTTQDTTIYNGGLGIIDAGAIVGRVRNEGILDLSKYDGTNIEITGDVGRIVVYELGKVSKKQLKINTLTGLQTFVVSADLLNNKADKISINNAIGTHYIKVLRELSDGSDLSQISGNSATIAVVTAGGADFKGAVSAIDGVNVRVLIAQDANNWNITGYELVGPSNLTITNVAGADMAYAALISGRDSLQQRLGEIMNTSNSNGVWARVYGGEYGIGANISKYSTIQGGYDWMKEVHNGQTVTGVSVEYFNANNSYINGIGKTSNTLFGIYHAWLGVSGHYYDIALKTGRMHNKMTVYDETNIDGGYSVGNTTVSAEYGYRKRLGKGYFITPQIALNFGHINAVDYTTDSNTKVRQDSINSLIGRIGVNIGRITKKSEFHVGVNLLHEFTARSKVATGRTRNAYTMEDDFRGSYIECLLGGSIKVGKNIHMYADVARSFGGKVVNKLQLQAGYRVSW